MKNRYPLTAVFRLSLLPALAGLCIPAYATGPAGPTANDKNSRSAVLTITVQAVKQPSGHLMLEVYNSEASFRRDAIRQVRQPARAGNVSIPIGELPAGQYAVMMFQDLNGNGKLDTNLFGIPNEPWGGSLQGKTVFGAPGWTDTRFDLEQPDMTISIQLN